VGVAAGVAVGTAVADSTNTTNAYDAGVAAGVAASSAPVGAIYTTLPPTGCAASTVDNTQLFNCGGVWFQPSYGANGVFYRVVPAP
jgi:hypothetical protein